MAGLIALPVLAIGVLGLALCLLHPLLQGQLPSLWDGLLLNSALFEPFAGHKVRVGYAILPWFGVLALGYGIGGQWLRNRKHLAWLGLFFVLAFVTMRLLGLGNPKPMEPQPTSLFSLLSFLNCQKYPPSPAYLGMTLGPALLLLAYLPDQPPNWTRPLLAYGRVPLFFYVAHLWLLRYTSIPLAFMRWGKDAADFSDNGHALSPEVPLWGCYVAWLLALALLYKPCLKWAQKKIAGPQWWWQYL